MVAALRRAGADCDWLIPDRLADGYGLSAGIARASCAERGTGLLVTVDCGIGSVDGDRRRSGPPGSTSSSPTITSPGERLPDCPIVHPVVGELPVRGPLRRRGRRQARPGARARLTGDESARDPRPRPRRARHRRRPRPARRREPLPGPPRPRADPPLPAARAAGADGDLAGRAGADRRGRHRLPARAAAERRRAPLPRRRRGRADAHRRPRPGRGDRRRARRRQPRAPRDRAGGQQRGRGGAAGAARRAALGARDRRRRRGLAPGRRRDRRLAARRASRAAGDRALDRRRRHGEGIGPQRRRLRPARRARCLRRSARPATAATARPPGSSCPAGRIDASARPSPPTPARSSRRRASASRS